MINTGERIRRSDAGLLSTLGWTDAAGTPTYCLEGSLFNAGTVVQWLRDGLQIIDSADAVNRLAMEVPDSGGVMLVPAFTGWGTPHWDPQARGLMVGLTRDSSRGHIARAALEGIALSVATLVELAENALGKSLGELTVRRPASLESTARGVALFAGLQAGVVTDLHDLAQQRSEGADRFEPQIDTSARTAWRRRWNDAVTRSLGWHG